MLAKAVQKLLASSTEGTDQSHGDLKPKITATTVEGGAREGSVKRVLLVRDRRTGESWRFGFVEFAGVEVITPKLSVTVFFFNEMHRTRRQLSKSILKWKNLPLQVNRSKLASYIPEFSYLFTTQLVGQGTSKSIHS